MDVRSVIQTKRDGGELSQQEIEFFLGGYVRGEIENYHAAALTACIFTRGMTPPELVTWTHAMLHSGVTLAFPEIPQKKADKHSTGGVGDKVSIPLAPAVAACGIAVPMISGRGLGHTGGTLDKLESIPGFRVKLSDSEIHRAIDRTGVAFGAQTKELVPADRLLYALRDACGLVESIPLIASSIMSKKLAEGIDALVLDVKFGSGAFLPDPARGKELADVMISLARGMNVKCSAFQTAMDRPLGRACGHALEIVESIECLSGGGPADLRELVLLQGGEMLRLTGIAKTLDEGKTRVADAIDSGRALGVFELILREQGGDARILKDTSILPRAPDVDPWKADHDGTFSFVDVRAIGHAINALGGGRTKVTDEIDPAVGLVWRKATGDAVKRGDLLCEIHHRGGRGLDACRALLSSGARIGAPSERTPLVRAHIAG
ncbi:MAG: thymidine phosphorylase [Planctomycetota bacterium]|nr:thymidine phosphorylase [Planctomycetota bacterium]